MSIATNLIITTTPYQSIQDYFITKPIWKTYPTKKHSLFESVFRLV